MTLKTISATDKPFTSAIGLQPIWSTQNTQGQIPTRGLEAENIVNENFQILEDEAEATKQVFYNVFQAAGVTYNDKTAARNAVPANLRGLGQIITYKLTTGWVTEQYIGTDVSEWTTDSNWKEKISLDIIDSRYLYTLLTSDHKKLLTFDKNAIPFIANLDKALTGIVSEDSFSVDLLESLSAALQMRKLNTKWRSIVTDSNSKLLSGVNMSGSPVNYNKPFVSPYEINIDSASREEILTNDLPHESKGIYFYNVLKISDNLWYMWYASMKLDIPNEFQADLCFAYSSNGKDWTKGIPDQPERSNIIISGANDKAWTGQVVFIEPTDKDYPYRMFYSAYKADAEGEDALYMAKSANGWDWGQSKLILNKKFDTQHSVQVLPDGNYLVFLRLWNDPFHTDRQVGVALVDKNGNVLLSPRFILSGGLYTSAVHRIQGNDYILFPTIYNRQADSIILSYSYYLNGIAHNTYEDITAQLLPSGMDLWATVCPVMIPTGNPAEYWLFYYGRDKKHFDSEVATNTVYYRIKLTIKQR